MNSVTFMVIQAVLAVIGLRQLLFKVFPNLHRLRYPGLVTDIWGPIALTLPMIVMVGHIDGDVGGVGWVPIGGSMLCAFMAIGLVFLTFKETEANLSRPGSRSQLVWIAVALTYLLLSIAHNMTVWTGQIMFAIGAVLLWLNTPDETQPPQASHDEDSKVGSGMRLAVLCSLGQGIAAYMAGPDYSGISGAMMVGYTVIGLAGAARIAGPEVTIRLGGWAATFGMLFSLGVSSLLFMTPTIFGFFTGSQPTVTVRVAHGFGQYAIEAMGLLMLGPATLLASRLSVPRRRLLGATVILGVALLAAMRLARI